MMYPKDDNLDHDEPTDERYGEGSHLVNVQSFRGTK